MYIYKLKSCGSLAKMMFSIKKKNFFLFCFINYRYLWSSAREELGVNQKENFKKD